MQFPKGIAVKSAVKRRTKFWHFSILWLVTVQGLMAEERLKIVDIYFQNSGCVQRNLIAFHTHISAVVHFQLRGHDFKSSASKWIATVCFYKSISIVWVLNSFSGMVLWRLKSPLYWDETLVIESYQKIGYVITLHWTNLLWKYVR